MIPPNIFPDSSYIIWSVHIHQLINGLEHVLRSKTKITLSKSEDNITRHSKGPLIRGNPNKPPPTIITTEIASQDYLEQANGCIELRIL